MVPAFKELTVQLEVKSSWPTVLARYIPPISTEILQCCLSITSSEKPDLISLQPVSPQTGQVSRMVLGPGTELILWDTHNAQAVLQKHLQNGRVGERVDE